jgi:hypothetical protein
MRESMCFIMEIGLGLLAMEASSELLYPSNHFKTFAPNHLLGEYFAVALAYHLAILSPLIRQFSRLPGLPSCGSNSLVA